MELNRREFIKITSAFCGGLTLNICLPSFAETSLSGQFQPNIFVTFNKSGEIIFHLTKHEMGQGVSQSLPTIFADELGARWEDLKVIQAPYSPTYSMQEQGNTGGSNSIRRLWQPLREAAATTRQLFVDAACRFWDSDAEHCLVEESAVKHKITGKTVSFTRLLDIAAVLPLPENVPLKPASEFHLIGKSLPNPRNKEIVAGQLTYTSDISAQVIDMPDMLYALVTRCPYYRGNVKSFLADDAMAIAGVNAVYQQQQYWGEDDSYVAAGVAVLAGNLYAALQAKKTLKINWSPGPFGNENSQQLQQLMQDKLQQEGESELQLGEKFAQTAKQSQVFSATYQNPFQAHATMETLGAIASVSKDKVVVWGAMQNPALVASEISKITKLPLEKVEINLLPSGGSFGRRYYADIVLEAVFLSIQAGKPVKVMWTREDDIQNSFVHALQLDQHQAYFDEKGKLTHWQLKQVICSDGGTRAHAWNPYGIANQNASSVFLPGRLPIGAWRSVWAHQAALGLESFVDELAHLQRQDPLEYRIQLLKQPHPGLKSETLPWYARQYEKDQKISIALLELAAEKSQWYGKKSEDHGRGIAIYRFLTGGHVAHVVDVSVTNNVLKIHKVTSAVYIGTAINPETVKAQVEGSIIWGLSAVLYNKVDIEEGKIVQSNLHDYPLVKMSEVPQMDIHILRSDDAPLGIGEPAVPPLTPAVLNAIYDASGIRIRELPVSKYFA